MNNKTLNVVLALLLFAVLASVGRLYAKDEKANQDYISQVTLDKAERFNLRITYPFLFEGEELPSVLKEGIAADINRFFLDGIDAIEAVPLSEKNLRPGSRYQIYDRIITHRLHIKGRYSWLFPEVLKKYFKGVVKVDDKYHVLIHRKVIEKYKEAFKLKKKHPDMFAKIGEFIAFLENSEMMNKLADDPEEAKKMLYMLKGQSLKKGIRWIRELAVQPYMKIKYPSLLNIVPLEKDFPGQGRGETGIFIIRTQVGFRQTDKEGNSRYIMEPFAAGAYVNGQWRIFVWPMP